MDETRPLEKQATIRVHATSSTFLYYARAVNPTILSALNEIYNQQVQPTKASMSTTHELPNTHSLATIRFHASDMVLSLVPDAEYLVLPNARSRCAALYTLSNNPTSSPPVIKPYGSVHVLVKTMHGVPYSASVAESSGIFLCCTVGCTHSSHSCWIGSQTTGPWHSHKDRQLNCPWHSHVSGSDETFWRI